MAQEGHRRVLSFCCMLSLDSSTAEEGRQQHPGPARNDELSPHSKNIHQCSVCPVNPFPDTSAQHLRQKEINQKTHEVCGWSFLGKFKTVDSSNSQALSILSDIERHRVPFNSRPFLFTTAYKAKVFCYFLSECQHSIGPKVPDLLAFRRFLKQQLCVKSAIVLKSADLEDKFKDLNSHLSTILLLRLTLGWSLFLNFSIFRCRIFHF